MTDDPQVLTEKISAAMRGSIANRLKNAENMAKGNLKISEKIGVNERRFTNHGPDDLVFDHRARIVNSTRDAIAAE